MTFLSWCGRYCPLDHAEPDYEVHEFCVAWVIANDRPRVARDAEFDLVAGWLVATGRSSMVDAAWRAWTTWQTGGSNPVRPLSGLQ